MSTAIQIHDLSKRFGSTNALNNVNLHLNAGELVALLGPSGSGKTTLLRAIAGLDFPDAGRILFNGEDALRLSIQERRVGFVFQHYALFRHMSVLDNIAFGLRCKPRKIRPNNAAILKIANALLEAVQLTGLGKRYPHQLSGGQRQRVALARALAIDPTILLLDEPFGALDAKVRGELRAWLRQLHDETGHTTLFVTHDQEEAMELADRIVVFHQGQIQQEGSPNEVYDLPANHFVFDFLGRGSYLEGHYGPDGFKPHQSQRILSTIENTPSERIYIRPHDFELVDENQGLAAHVLASRRYGGRLTLEVNVEGQSQAIELDLPHHAGHCAPLKGERLWILPRRAHSFKS